VRVWAVLPDPVMAVMAGFWWDDDRLRGLSLPVAPVALSELAWGLEIPFWSDGRKPYSVRGRDLLEDPDRYPEHRRRVHWSDLRHPLALYEKEPGRWIILDGYHRLVKAAREARTEVPVVRLPDAAVPGVLVRHGFDGALNALYEEHGEFLAEARSVAQELAAERGG
jgi:hypothetical protein